MNSILRTCAYSLLASIALLAFSACSEEAPPPAADTGEMDSHNDEPMGDGPSNRIDIPEAVRTNLGITFATVERRDVENTLRVPGSFELAAEGMHHYTASFAGFVQLADGLSEYGVVKQGQLLYTLDAPIYYEIRNTILAEQIELENVALDRPLIEAEIEYARAAANPLLFEGRREAIRALAEPGEAHRKSLEAAISLWRERLDELNALKQEGAVVLNEIAEAKAKIASLQTEIAATEEEHSGRALALAEIDAEELAAKRELPLAESKLQALDIEVAKAERRYQQALLRAASRVRMSVAELTAEDASGTPQWKRFATIEVRARKSGIVSEFPINDGAWVEQGADILDVLDPSAIRFRARVQQVDIQKVAAALASNNVSAGESVIAARLIAPGTSDAFIDCTLRPVPSGDPEMRTFDLLAYPTEMPAWAQVGVRTSLELALAGDGEESLMIPRDAVIRDGLKDIVFRRDPWDDEKVIRIEPIFGRVSGEWIEILSAVAPGDQVVLGGIYELKLASGTSEQLKGGHFHADGTWHEGEH